MTEPRPTQRLMHNDVVVDPRDSFIFAIDNELSRSKLHRFVH